MPASLYRALLPSLSCPANTVGFYFITLDRVTKTVVVEKEHFTGRFSGNITDINDGVIKFTFGPDRLDPHDSLSDERSRSLTLIGIAGDLSRPTVVQACIMTSRDPLWRALTGRAWRNETAFTAAPEVR
jgi:hypothetical protein